MRFLISLRVAFNQVFLIFSANFVTSTKFLGSGMKWEEYFLKSFRDSILYWVNFKKEEAKEYESYSLILSNMLESRSGYGALHSETFPND